MVHSISTNGRVSAGRQVLARTAVAILAAAAVLWATAAVALGATPLQQSTPIAWDEPKSDCMSRGTELLEPNEVLWYFVLSGPTDSQATLSATFAQKGSRTTQGELVGGNLEFFVITGLPDTLQSAQTDTDGERLDLTHVCAMRMSDPFPTPAPTATPKPPKATPKPTPAPTSTPKPAKATPKPTPPPTQVTTPEPTDEPPASTAEPVTPAPVVVVTPMPTPPSTEVVTPDPATPEPAATADPTAEPTVEAVALPPAPADGGTPTSATADSTLILVVVLVGLAVGLTTVAFSIRKTLRRRPLTRVLG